MTDEDMNLSGGLTPHISVEAAIRILAWHIEQLVKDDEARAELRQTRKDMEFLIKAKLQPDMRCQDCGEDLG